MIICFFHKLLYTHVTHQKKNSAALVTLRYMNLIIHPIAVAQHGTDYKITCICLSVSVSVVTPKAAIFIRSS